MEFSNPGGNFMEAIAQPQEADNFSGEFALPQGAEFINEEVAPPHAADNNKSDFAASERVDTESMTDAEFMEHIRAIKDGTVPNNAKNIPEKQLKPEEEVTQKTDEPYRKFDTEEEFKGFISQTVKERLKGSREDKEKYDSIVRKAQSIYGGSAEDAVDKMFADIEKRAADEKGMPVEEYRENISIKQDALSYRASKEAQAHRQAEIDAQIERWKTESEQLRSAIPDFDFEKAMENDVFKSAVLEQGMSLPAAYIFATKSSTANQKPKRQEVYEVGNSRMNNGQARGIDPMEMSDEEFKKYIAGRRNS